MAGGDPLDIWNEWATQILVLLSLTLQVVLLLFAGIRRREASAVPTFLLWLAYLLADSTAIYALGHIWLSGAPSNKHQLVAFWAPFLLLHLGGPDSITAYSLEDSQLWLRHLQNLVVQVLGAAYVLYKYVAAGDSFVLLAAVLMFSVGVVKYGERTWALMLSNLDSIRDSLEEHVGEHQHFHPPDYESMVAAIEDDEFYLRRAHSMFHVCKRAIVDSWVASPDEEKEDDHQNSWEENHPAETNQQSLEIELDIKTELKSYKGLGMWTLMEMELSLMYDLLYTKAGMIYTWHGYGIRVATSVAAAASFLLFQFSSKDGFSRVDVAVSYTLLSGALILETASLLRALGSTWTYAFLCNTTWSWLRYTALCSGRWDRLRWFFKIITGRNGLYNRSPRRWSGKIGQHNMLHACSRRKRAYKSLLGRLARMLGYEDWFIRYHFSGTMELSQDLKHQLFEYTRHLTGRGRLNMQGVIRKNWGEEAFEYWKEMDLYYSLATRGRNNYLGVEFQEGVIIWHIATDIFIANSRGEDDAGDADLVRDIRTLSNYMVFLMVDSPNMLPGLAQSMLYRQTCDNLEEIRKHNPDRHKKDVCTKIKEFFRLHDDPNSNGLMHVDGLADILSKEEPPLSLTMPRLYFSYRVAGKLHDRGKADMLQLLLYVWMDFLVYAANKCSRESHAKKLNNGGGLTTILWLMIDYLHRKANAAHEKRRRGGV
ncbi:hypothetical protein BDA96_06G016500 [Sorghum bicolor]|uniref:DUF4220 domain-containing protein n=1 Tax=Sorghum bicolor TaxID=4558 RepID=A0A921QQI2_SORBI|nr:hypothetical protein BDA96_06G016500 [Sorghum bicolor]